MYLAIRYVRISPYGECLNDFCSHSVFCMCRGISSSSSSSIGCGAGDHKVSPCTTIISKCGNLLFLHCSFIIPKQSLYIIKVWSTWSTRSPFANGWNVQSISSSRLFLWHVCTLNLQETYRGIGRGRYKRYIEVVSWPRPDWPQC